MEIVLKRKWMGRLCGAHLIMNEQKALELIQRGTARSVQEKKKKPKFPRGMKKVQKNKMMRTSPAIKSDTS